MLGISEKVNSYHRGLLRRIISDAKKSDNWIKPNIKGGSLLFDVEGSEIKVCYMVIYVKNIGDVNIDDFVVMTGYDDNGYIELHSTIVFDGSSGKYIDFEGSTQHELEHVYQQILSGKQILSNDKARKIYDTAISLSQSGDWFKMIVGYSIYYSFKFEKDAYANEIYRLIMNDAPNNPYESLKNNAAYKSVRLIKKTVLEKDNRDKIEPIVEKYFGKSYEWFLNITSLMIKKFISKAGKVLTKAMEDIELQNKKNDATDDGRMTFKYKMVER